MPHYFTAEDSNRRRVLLRTLQARQGHLCAYCERRMDPRVQNMAPTLDEQVPRWLGGVEDEINCVACCYGCNQRKGPMPAADFRAVRTLGGQAYARVHQLWQEKAQRRIGDPGVAGKLGSGNIAPRGAKRKHGGSRADRVDRGRQRYKTAEQVSWEDVYGEG